MKKILKNAKGAALVEYGILVGLITIMAISAVLLLGTEIQEVFNSVQQTLESNMTAAGV